MPLKRRVSASHTCGPLLCALTRALPLSRLSRSLVAAVDGTTRLLRAFVQILWLTFALLLGYQITPLLVDLDADADLQAMAHMMGVATENVTFGTVRDEGRTAACCDALPLLSSVVGS